MKEGAMTKEQRRKKFLKEHPQYNPDVAGSIFKFKKPSNWRNKFKHIDYFAEVPRELKMATRKITRQLVKDGVIKKRNCQVCRDKDTEAHHEDYSDPFTVRWFCSFHHAKRHKVLNRVSLTSK